MGVHFPKLAKKRVLDREIKTRGPKRYFFAKTSVSLKLSVKKVSVLLTLLLLPKGSELPSHIFFHQTFIFSAKTQ